tara:strand:+ start:4674 stop:5045 length:372 start_codon:yes stop_codon:yes gene_type:complete
MFSYVDLESRTPADHPIRKIRKIVDTAHQEIEIWFDDLYATDGRPSIPPLTQEDRKTIGQDIMAAEFGWPCGEPLCKSLSGYAGLWEVRSNIKSGIARVFFYIDKSEMILLHGLVKKDPENTG